MKISARFVRRVALFFVLSVVIPIIGVLIVFNVYQSPITIGEIEYSIPYKSDKYLDIYYPTRAVYQKSPIILFFHGGGWMVGRKESINMFRFNESIAQLRESGYTVISPEYTLASSGKSPFPSCIIDAYDAVDWVLKNADEFHLDVSNFGVFGESAGAHIALMVAYCDPAQYMSGYRQFPFDYVVDIYGPSDLRGLYESALMDSINKTIEKLPISLAKRLDISSQLLGFDPNSDTLRAYKFMETYSPIHYVNAQAPTTLVIHGDEDLLVPVEQSIALKNSLDKVGVLTELHIVKGVNHAFIGATTDQNKEIQSWIVDFITKQYSHEEI